MTISITGFTAAADSWVHDTLVKTLTGSAPDQYKLHSTGARYHLQTSDTTLAIEGVWPQYYNGISVYINGVFSERLVPASFAVKQTMVATLGAGSKLVEIVEEDAFLTGLGSPGCSIQITPYYAPAKRVILYGTSIDVGFYAASYHLGWSELVRHGMISSDYRIANGSVAGAQAYFENLNGAAQNAFVASLASMVDGTESTEFWSCRETNDYGGAPWTAAAYQAAMTTLFTKLRAAYPAIQVREISALLRASPAEGTPNGLGDSLAAYRTAGIAACTAANVAAGATFCAPLDGTAMGLLTFVDGLHPDTAGHAAEAVWAAAHWFTTPDPPAPTPAPSVIMLPGDHKYTRRR